MPRPRPTAIDAPPRGVSRGSRRPLRLLRAFAPGVLAFAPAGQVQARQARNTVATDKAALVALYDATDGANWTTGTNWTSDEALGDWHGVATDSDGRVTALALDDNGLNGALPAALGDLGELERLDLRGNDLSGALPSSLTSLANLASLLLSRSWALTGAVPGGLRELAGLDTLAIDDTELCAPRDAVFRAWLDTISFNGLICPPA